MLKTHRLIFSKKVLVISFSRVRELAWKESIKLFFESIYARSQFQASVVRSKNSFIMCFKLQLTFKTLVALRIANSATPTSANTASHKVATPIAPSNINNALTAIARMMFCQTIE